MTSGGKAPGPQPLRECLVKLEGMLSEKENGDKLSPIEVHDMVCHVADAVLAGGIRRAALISLFSADDEEMIAKYHLDTTVTLLDALAASDPSVTREAQ